MTTAIKKKKTKKKKASKKRKRAPKKKPAWSIVSFEQIDARRQELGYSKAEMAQALNVTNSTYHNWRRGETTPHPGQQEVILRRLHSLSPKKGAIIASGSLADVLAQGNGNDASHATSRGPDGAVLQRGTFHGGAAVSSGGNTWGYHPANSEYRTATAGAYTKVPRDVASIAATSRIVRAFIESQKKPTSAGSVVALVRELQEAFAA